MTEIIEAPKKIRYALFSSGADFSCRVLEHLIQKGHNPELIVIPEYPATIVPTQPEFNLQGNVTLNPVLRLNPEIAVEYAPQSWQGRLPHILKSRDIDYLLVVCWPYLISNAVIDCAARAALNLHPSMLPNFRGPNPIDRQIEQNSTDFGVSLHLLNDHFDRGDIVSQRGFQLAREEINRTNIETRCAQIGAQLFITAALLQEQGWKLLKQQD